jgi:hypothetical protein
MESGADILLHAPEELLGIDHLKTSQASIT